MIESVSNLMTDRKPQIQGAHWTQGRNKPNIHTHTPTHKILTAENHRQKQNLERSWGPAEETPNLKEQD